jgi:CheY-like chemotaxis protein
MGAALQLVRAAPERSDRDSAAANDSEKKGNGHPAPSTILVVADEVLIRFAIADYLRDRGYRVLEANNAEQAQALLRAGELVEILFTDVHLGPGITGFELATWVRANFKDIRIIVTSGVHKAAEVAADLCDGPLLTKPYSYEQLLEHIRRLLGSMGRRSGE